jgi:aspartyl protease
MYQSLLFAVLSVFAVLQPPSDISALLAKHRAYLGWTFGDGTLTSWRSETRYKPSSTATPDPNQTPDPETTPGRDLVLRTVRRAVQYREIGSRGGAINDSDTGFTGQVFWTANLNNYTVTVLRDRARLLLTENMLEDEELATLPGELRGTAKVGDVDTQIVRVKPQQGFVTDLYVDAEGAYRRAVIAADTDRKLTIDFDKYIEVLPGKKVVGEYHFAKTGSYVVDHFEANAAISDQELHPPAPRPVWTFAEPSPVPINIVSHTVVFGSTGGRAVMFRASIDGHEGTFLLDSGSAICILFGAFGDSVNLPKIGHSAFGSIMAGRVESDLVNVDKLKIGNSVLHNVVFMQAHNDAFKEFDGIIGFDVLAKAIVDVDIGNHKMTILDPTKYEAHPEKNSAVFPVDLSTRQPAVQITLADGVPAYPFIDTGNDYLVLISDAFRKSGKLLAVTAAYTRDCIRPSRMMIGPIPYENGLTCFANSSMFGTDGGLIGFDFLRHFNWTFDYPHGHLILTPNGLN